VIAELVAPLLDEVTGELSRWSHAQATAPDPGAERGEAERLLSIALEQLRRQRLAQGLAPIEAEDEAMLLADVRARLHGFGLLDQLLADPSLENLHANGCDRVFIIRAGGERVRGPQLAASDAELIELIRRVAAHGGRTERRFDDARPLLNLRLPDGSRLSAVMQVSGRPSLSVRRHRHTDIGLDDLVELGTLDETLAAVMRAAVSRPFPLNIVVAGGTDAGKTTFLRALLAEVEPWERLVVIEDALELQLERDPDRHPDVVELETREANVEGAGEISMRDLARHALRMAPDRVIVGEVRGGEVLEMLLAMSQGNDGSLCTLHADSSAAALTKIATYALMARERMPVEATNLLIAQSVGLVVHLVRQADGHRLVSSVREVTGADGRMVSSNEVFVPGPDGRARLAHAFTTRTWDRLVANGMDADVIHRGLRREVAWA
jgi:pilus assembly protein CpaF